jgi:hypothetical protein
LVKYERNVPEENRENISKNIQQKLSSSESNEIPVYSKQNQPITKKQSKF